MRAGKKSRSSGSGSGLFDSPSKAKPSTVVSVQPKTSAISSGSGLFDRPSSFESDRDKDKEKDKPKEKGLFDTPRGDKDSDKDKDKHHDKDKKSAGSGSLFEAAPAARSSSHSSGGLFDPLPEKKDHKDKDKVNLVAATCLS